MSKQYISCEATKKLRASSLQETDTRNTLCNRIWSGFSKVYIKSLRNVNPVEFEKEHLYV